MGDKLIDAKYVYRYEEKPHNDGYLTFHGINGQDVYYSVDGDEQKASVSLQINSWEKSSPTILYAQYVRKHGDLSEYAKKAEIASIDAVEDRKPEGNHTATFAGLASSSCGADLIGALRMDVDDMGNTFKNIGSLSELSVKSRMLNLFFKVYLNEICAGNLGKEEKPTDIVGKNYQNREDGEKGRNVSVVYAGGDDLFILGAWDETAELAFDIQRCFARFTGGSFDGEKKGCGISGGLTLHQPKFPLYQMAQKSGEAEHVAKNKTGQKKKDGLKNRIALFYAENLMEIEREGKIERVNKDDDRLMLSIDWNQFTELIRIVSYFAIYRDTEEKRFVLKYLSNRFTYSLLDTTYEWHEKQHLSLPHVLWLLRKHAKELQSKTFENEDGLSYFKRKIIGRFIDVFPILHLPLIWIELLKRRG